MTPEERFHNRSWILANLEPELRVGLLPYKFQMCHIDTNDEFVRYIYAGNAKERIPMEVTIPFNPDLPEEVKVKYSSISLYARLKAIEEVICYVRTKLKEMPEYITLPNIAKHYNGSCGDYRSYPSMRANGSLLTVFLSNKSFGEVRVCPTEESHNWEICSGFAGADKDLLKDLHTVLEWLESNYPNFYSKST